MMLRVAWQWTGKDWFHRGTVTGYTEGEGGTRVIVLRDPHPPNYPRRNLVALSLEEAVPQGWRREYKIT